MSKKYTKTYAHLSTEELAILKLEAMTAKFNALLAKLDADATVTDTDYAALLSETAPSDEII